VKVKINGNGKSNGGKDLEKIIKKLIEFKNYEEKLEKYNIPKELIEGMLKEKIDKTVFEDLVNLVVLSNSIFKNIVQKDVSQSENASFPIFIDAPKGLSEEVIKNLNKQGLLIKRISEGLYALSDQPKKISVNKTLSVAKWIIQLDEDNNKYEIRVEGIKNNKKFEAKINLALLISVIYKNIKKTYKFIESLDKPPFELIENGTTSIIKSKEALIETIINGGKKGLVVQRYKGLGEMNPDQLWETTMDPEKRILLQVKTDDAVAADEMFTVLMGDQVEPRREFIQQHSNQVRNLDV
jgi:DNA gyrase subunit B